MCVFFVRVVILMCRSTTRGPVVVDRYWLTDLLTYWLSEWTRGSIITCVTKNCGMERSWSERGRWKKIFQHQHHTVALLPHFLPACNFPCFLENPRWAFSLVMWTPTWCMRSTTTPSIPAIRPSSTSLHVSQSSVATPVQLQGASLWWEDRATLDSI